MVYQPLCPSRNEIRLLRVHPESTIGLISCDLFHVSLDSCPAFLAISYAWGSSVHTKKVLVNGKLHNVTASCWDVLHTNTSLIEYHGMPIWIDAICINQEDEWEREREVLRMHWIYRKGFIAVNLAGGLRGREMRRRDRKAVRALEILAGRRSGERQTLSWKTEDEVLCAGDDGEEEEIHENEIEDYISSSLPHITHFLNNPWFSRTWIIQEFTLGLKTPDAPLLGNGAIISASGLVSACIALASRISFLPTVQQRALLTGISRYLRLASAAVMHTQGTAENTLLRFLCLFRDHGASDARDKVYSLLGLFQSRGDAVGCATYDTSSLPIDYAASLETVYARTVQSIVLATHRLDVLCAGQQSTEFSQSWTPDWRQPWRRASLNSNVGIGRKERDSRCAAKGLEARVVFSKDLKVMSVRGVLYGEVLRVGMKWSERSVKNPPSVAEEMDCLRTSCDRNARRGKSEVFGKDNDSGYSTEDFDVRTDEDHNDPISDLTNAMAAGFTPTSHTPSNPLKYLPHTSAEWFEKAQQSSPLTARFIKMSEGRRTFRTNIGTFGLGPEELEAGDMVAVLFGCSVPVVLRPVEGMYKFVGECYVDKIMKGEMIEDLEKRHIGERVFDIR